MHLDAPTLIILTSGIAIVASLWLASEWGRGREEPLLHWSAGFALIAFGCIISLTRLSGDYRLGVWFSYGALIAAHALFLRGNILLVGRQPKVWWAFGIPVWVVSFLIVPDLGRAESIVLVVSLTVAVQAFASAWILLKAPSSQRSLRLLCVIFTFHGVVYIARAALLGVPGGFINIGRFEGFAISAVLFEGIIVSILFCILLVFVISERREAVLVALADRDPLTGAFNRRAFVTGAKRNLPSAANASDETDTALLLFDLDNFKALNDAHGHTLGDTVLKLFADIAHSIFNAGTIFARLGGEEFAALVPRTTLAQAEVQAAQLLKTFADTCAIVDGRVVNATVSAGLCMSKLGSGRLDTMMEKADKALYEAKRCGRNQVKKALGLDQEPGYQPALTASPSIALML